MTTYHCTDRNCEATFQMEHARSCPFCGGKTLRHAMGYEVDRMEREESAQSARLPIFILPGQAAALA